MKKISIIISMILIMSTFEGCTSFNEIYKPLYQTKPLIESTRGEN